MKDIKYKNGLYTLGFTSYKGTSTTLGNYDMFIYQTKYVQCNITIYDEQEIRLDSLNINIDLDAIMYDLKVSNNGEDSYQFAWKQIEK